MQYILSEEEMAKIAELTKSSLKMPSLDDLAKFCKMVASEMVLEGSTDSAAGCIHVRHPDGPGYQRRYCDRCIVSTVCPLTKEWSK